MTTYHTKGLQMLKATTLGRNHHMLFKTDSPSLRKSQAHLVLNRIEQPHQTAKGDNKTSGDLYHKSIAQIQALTNQKNTLSRIKGELLYISKMTQAYRSLNPFKKVDCSIQINDRSKQNINVYKDFQWAIPHCNKYLQEHISKQSITPYNVDSEEPTISNRTNTTSARTKLIPKENLFQICKECRTPVVPITECDFNEYSFNRKMTELNALKLYGGLQHSHSPTRRKRNFKPELETIFGRHHLTTGQS